MGEASLKAVPCPSLTFINKMIKLFSAKPETTICHHHSLK